MFAIIETGGKQYKVSEGDIIFVEKLEAAEGETVTIDKVLAVSAANGFVVGAPYTNYKVTANVVKNGKGKKLQIQEKRKEAYRSQTALYEAADHFHRSVRHDNLYCVYR